MYTHTIIKILDASLHEGARAQLRRSCFETSEQNAARALHTHNGVPSIPIRWRKNRANDFSHVADSAAQQLERNT